jgi:acyl-CoA synthetase (AMP-forming)/AMP-acid ligase II
MAGVLWRSFEAAAEARGSAPAILQGDRGVSFAELRRWAPAYAAGLVARGLGPGDRCLVWAGNSPELAAALLGIWLAGGVATLVNDEAPLAHLTHAAEATGPRLALVEPAKADAAARALEIPVLALDRAPRDGELGPAEVHDHEPASVFFTSGSTGLPKGVTQSHANLAAGCRGVAERLRLRPDDRILCPVPWAFDYGYGQLLSTVLLGITQVLPVARNPFAVCEAITQHRPTVFAGLPSIYALLIHGVSPLGQTDLGSLRLAMNTGGAIAPAIFAGLLKHFGHCDISLNYGMTETYRSAGLPPALARERPESVGFAYPGVALSVLRETGEEAEPGEVGEIVHRGAGAFLGYWGAPEATRRVRRPDPFWRHGELAAPMAVFTGDLGWKDRDGFLMIKGRRDRLIKSMGVRVSPDEVEQLLRGSGLVSDVAVVGLPHELMGEMVAAAVVPAAPGAEPTAALKAFARQQMSQAMQPRAYRLIEALPLTPNGKPDLPAVRALFQAPAR